MKKLFLPFSLLALAVIFLFTACGSDMSGKKVLVFSKTEGWRHASIEDGIAAIKKLGREHKFKVYATEDAEKINEEFLMDFDAVVFLNTTLDILDHVQQADFERFIQAGGGFVGIHGAADTEYDWPWYGRLVGGYFDGHPNDPNVRKATIHPIDKEHACSQMIPENWERSDEWYNYKNLNPNINVLLNLDEQSYEGGTNGEQHPIAWYHEYDGGRAFYTGGGHTSESYEEPLFMEHLLAGIQYAVGTEEKNYALAKTKRVPPANRFVKNVLAQNLNEPMEFEIFDNGKVLIVERKGALQLFDPEYGYVDSIGAFDVYTGQEDGLLGIAKDPNYKDNNWVYFFYSPAGDIPKQHVSRFKFDGNRVNMDSEQLIIEIPVQRDECCHSGGSLEFGPDGNLFIGIGDDTNPFA
ncbi:MAG: ThuA domain-containing protein [Bacteroidota bacterium]